MNIGLIMSGGFAKGAYQIGALRAIENFIPLKEIKYMSSVSIGAINAYGFATGRMAALESMWNDICGDESKTFVTKIMRSNTLQQNIYDLCCGTGKLTSNFYTGVFDIKNKAICYKDLSKTDKDTVPDYLRATVALPIYNKSVKIGKDSFFDGGLVDNIPVYPLLNHNLDYVFCIYFDDIGYQFENGDFDSKIIKINFPQMSCVKNSFLISSYDIGKMISDGYERTMKVLTPIFANGYEDSEAVLCGIAQNNEAMGAPKLRLTTDVVITNVNKVVSKYAKRKLAY